MDKTYILAVAARGFSRHAPLDGFPTPPVNCRFSRHAAKSSSEKVKTYPQIVHDFKQLQRSSKSGLRVFEMLPLQDGCAGSDVTPFALSRMIKLGEYLAGRYGPLVPSLRDAGKDVALASCVPEQDYAQSTMALLHGLLNEKQFTRVDVRKLERDVVGVLGSRSLCPGLRDIEGFAQKAYSDEHEIFKGRDSGSLPRKHPLGVGEPRPAKEVAQSLSHWFCDAESTPCQGVKCLDLTTGSSNVTGQLMEAIAAHNSYLAANEVFQAYALADTHRHLEKLLAWFGDGRASDQVVKVDVADDFFFLKALTSLGHRVRDPVLPGARLVVEQYRKVKSKGSAKFWRVLVGGRVVTETLGVCGGEVSKGFCGVDTIKVHLRERAEASLFGVCAEPRDEL